MKKCTLALRYLSILMFAAIITGITGLTSCTSDDTDDGIEITILATPANPATEALTAEEASFKWDAVAGAASYTAQLKMNEFGTVVKEAVIDAPLTKVTFGDLEPGTEYYFHVRANDKYSEGKNSYFTEWLSFTTETVDPQYTPLATPQNVYADSETINGTSITFYWDVVENAVSYTYKITPQGGESRFGLIKAETITDQLSAKIEGLTAATTYSFQVRANPATPNDKYTSSAFSRAVAASTVGKLAKPVAVHEADEATVSSLKFKWEAIASADSYTYQYAVDGNEFGAETNITATEITITGLTDATVYKFRVKAVPADGSVTSIDSDYSDEITGTTISSTAAKLATPAPAVDGSPTAASYTVSWTAVDNAVKYIYQTDSETGPSAETTATSVTITGLAPATAYKIRVMAVPAEGSIDYFDSDYSGWVDVTTANAIPAITVSDVSELKAAMVDIMDGGTITLNPGTYNFTSQNPATLVYSLASVSITKGIKFEAANPDQRPRINAKSISVDANIETLSFKNIEYTSYNVSSADGALETTPVSDGYFINIPKGVTVNNVVIDGCYIHELGNGVLRANQNKGLVPNTSGVKNVTVTNNLFYNINGKNACIVNARETAGIANSVWVIRNNTITGIGVYGTVGKQRIFGLPQDQPTMDVSISNNTFFDVFCGDNCIDATSTGDNGKIVVEKNIFTAYGTNTIKLPRLGNNAACAVDSNLLLPAWATPGSPAPTNTTEGVDPEFPAAYQGGNVPADADFTPSATVKALGYGDTRWLQ